MMQHLLEELLKFPETTRLTGPYMHSAHLFAADSERNDREREWRRER